MNSIVKVVVGVLVGVSAAGGVAAFGSADSKAKSVDAVAFATFTDDSVQGLVAGVGRANLAKSRVTVSLVGLDPLVKYRLLTMSRPCSKQPTRGSISYSVPVQANSSGSFFVSRALHRALPLKAGWSEVLYETVGKRKGADGFDGLERRACAPVLAR